MTAKQFFKSKTFRCLLVLLTIALVAGGLLAILNDVLHISDEERTMRAIKSIYGKEMEYETVEVADSDKTNDYGAVDCVYLLDDGNYLVKATGKDGYKSGTVTVWIVALFDGGDFNGLKQVAVESNTKQTLMSNFKSSFYEVYVNDKSAVLGGKYFGASDDALTVKNVTSGATYSSKAINNAVNSGLYYIRTVLSNRGAV